MAAPTIHTQSSSFTVYEGQTARFYVVAAGSGTITYQWEKSDNSGGSWSDVGGATSSSYTTAATVRTTDNGDQYRCKVTNGSGTTTSTAATLTVWNPSALGSDLALWLDPSQGAYSELTGASATTRVTTDGTAIGTFRAQNGTINGVAPASGQRPVYRPTGLNGLPCIEFTAASSQCFNFTTDLAGVTNNKSYLYMFAAVASDSAATERCVLQFSNGTSSGSARAGIYTNTGGTAGTLSTGGRRLDANSFAAASVASGFIAAEPAILGSEVLYASSDIYLRKNKTRVASNTAFQTDGATSATNSLGVSVGAYTNLSGGFFNAKIGHIVVVAPSTTMSATDIGHVESFLQWKSGLPTPDWNLTSRSTGLTAATTTNVTVCAPVAGTALENDLTTHKYRHQTLLADHFGKLHLAYTSGAENEDSASQQIGYCYSTDYGDTWSSPAQLIPSQSAWSSTSAAFSVGHIANCRKWIKLDGRLFFVSAIDLGDGDPPGFFGLTGILLACREVLSDGSFGTPFRISPDDYTALDGKTKLDYDSTLGPRLFNEADVFGTWGGSFPTYTQADWDGWMTEGSLEFAEFSTVYRSSTDPDSLLRIVREFGLDNPYAYATYSTDGGATWGYISPTNVPSSPSLVRIVRLNDGRYAMFGNVAAGRTELYVAILDATNLQVSSARAIRTGIGTSPTYLGTYKSGGAAYPDSIQAGNYLYVSYSLQKETIAFSRVLIPGETANSNYSASIAVTAPTLDQQVTAGTSVSVTATTSGTSGTYHVYLSFDGGFSFPLQIGTSVSLPYSWSVAESHIQSNAMIRVVDSSDSNIIGDSQLFDVIESSGSGSGTVNLLLLGVG